MPVKVGHAAANDGPEPATEGTAIDPVELAHACDDRGQALLENVVAVARWGFFLAEPESQERRVEPDKGPPTLRGLRLELPNEAAGRRELRLVLGESIFHVSGSRKAAEGGCVPPRDDGRVVSHTQGGRQAVCVGDEKAAFVAKGDAMSERGDCSDENLPRIARNLLATHGIDSCTDAIFDHRLETYPVRKGDCGGTLQS